MTEQQAIEQQLRQVYTEADVKLWMTQPHRLLGDAIPLDLIAQGRAAKVLAVATQLAESAYA